ncbi:hypothetical protein [Nocardia sp. NPDC057227]|uniref:hypothetical protein n=1 Tax=Nocardia sp. NPDC057227 TaxID=3346056 RepID=UPI00362C1144
MSHTVTALVIPGPCSPEAAAAWDLVPVPLAADLTLFHLTHYYTAYQQAVQGISDQLVLPATAPLLFPREGVVTVIAAALAGPTAFALIHTNYTAGIGEQYAVTAEAGAPPRPAGTINAALRALGITARPGLDEFDTVGLARHRSPPDHLDRFADLCDELGV